MGRDERPIFNCVILKIVMARPYPLFARHGRRPSHSKIPKKLFLDIPSSPSPVENKFQNQKGMILK